MDNRNKLENSEEDPSRNLGLGMIVLAWVTIIALLGFFFFNQEINQQNPNRNAETEQLEGETRLTLKENRYHHYVASGMINNSKVTLLIDTGATSVAIPAKLQKKLNLPNGRTITVHTANGSVEAETTVINELNIGDIKLYNIEATLTPSMDYTDEILLGMSALKQLDVSFNEGQLTLVQSR